MNSSVSRDRLTDFVSTLSTLRETDLKSRLGRLTPEQREFLVKVLDVFKRVGEPNELVHHGGEATLLQIEKVLRGRAAQLTQEKVKKFPPDYLLPRLEEVKTLHQLRQDPSHIETHTLTKEKAATWVAMLDQLVRSRPEKQFLFFPMLREKEARDVFQKLQISLLSGTDALLSESEKDWIDKVQQYSQDQERTVPLTFEEQFHLWFSRIMASRLIKDVIQLQKDVSQLQKQSEVLQIEPNVLAGQIHILSKEITRAKEIQNAYPNPILKEKIAMAEQQLTEVMQQQEERQKEDGYLFFREQLLQVAEIDQTIAHVNQLEALWKRKREAGSTIGEIKKAMQDWVEMDSSRKRSIPSELLRISDIHELSFVWGQIKNNFVGRLELEKNKILGNPITNGWVTPDGIPVFDVVMVVDFFGVKQRIEEAEEAMLAERVCALQMAEEIAIYSAAKKEPNLFNNLQKLQRQRIDETVTSKAKALDALLDPFGAWIGKVYEFYMEGLQELVKLYNTTTYTKSDQIVKGQQYSTKQLETFEETISKRYAQFPQVGCKYLQKTFLRQQEQLLKSRAEDLMDNLASDVTYFFGRADLYPDDNTIDTAVCRMTCVYDVAGQGQVCLPLDTLFAGHQAALASLGWNKERMKNLMNVLAAGEAHSLNTARTWRLRGLSPDSGEVFKSMPDVAFVKNKEGNYELYSISLARVANKGNPTVEEGYDISVFRVVLDGQAIDRDGKPFKEAVKEVKISPPLYFDKLELERKLGLQVHDFPKASAKNTSDYVKMVDHMLQVMIDSIPDPFFREGIRKVLTEYNPHIH